MIGKEDGGSGSEGKGEGNPSEPTLSQDSPLKVLGTELGSIILIPKEYKGEYQTVEKAEARIAELTSELEAVKGELGKRDKDERAGLVTEIQAIDAKLEYEREEELDKMSLKELKPVKKLMLSTAALIDKHSLTSPGGKEGDEVKRRGLDGGDT